MSATQADFEVETFVNQQVEEIRKTIGAGKAIVACSGGVDSTVSAVLTHRAVGNNLLCVFFDTGFMRLDEPRMVVESLSMPPVQLPIKLFNVKRKFIKALQNLEDAEVKRKAFRETFYQVLSEKARSEGCEFMVQGTIYPDIAETKGGIKTQHNVLEQIGIDPVEKYGFRVVEPVAKLYKGQVRAVARYLGVPSNISERQPFPGPGLAVRYLGKIRSSKLKALKLSTQVVESKIGVSKPEQYFSVILENKLEKYPTEPIRKIVAGKLGVQGREVKVRIFQGQATGMVDGKRTYGKIVGVDISRKHREEFGWLTEKLFVLQDEILSENPSFTRVLYLISEKGSRNPYVAVIRAIRTKDFMTADVAKLSWVVLNDTAGELLKKCPDVSSVYYDITPKPPATIEFE